MHAKPGSVDLGGWMNATYTYTYTYIHTYTALSLITLVFLFYTYSQQKVIGKLNALFDD